MTPGAFEKSYYTYDSETEQDHRIDRAHLATPLVDSTKGGSRSHGLHSGPERKAQAALTRITGRHNPLTNV
jgi:hypothetical protein